MVFVSEGWSSENNKRLLKLKATLILVQRSTKRSNSLQKSNDLRRDSKQREKVKRHILDLTNYLRDEQGLFGRNSSHPGQGNGLINTFGVDEVTNRPLIAAVEVVWTTLSL